MERMVWYYYPLYALSLLDLQLDACESCLELKMEKVFDPVALAGSPSVLSAPVLRQLGNRAVTSAQDLAGVENGDLYRLLAQYHDLVEWSSIGLLVCANELRDPSRGLMQLLKRILRDGHVLRLYRDLLLFPHAEWRRWLSSLCKYSKPLDISKIYRNTGRMTPSSSLGLSFGMDVQMRRMPQTTPANSVVFLKNPAKLSYPESILPCLPRMLSLRGASGIVDAVQSCSPTLTACSAYCVHVPVCWGQNLAYVIPAVSLYQPSYSLRCNR